MGNADLTITKAPASLVCDECLEVLRAESVAALTALVLEHGWRVGAPDTTEPDLCGKCA